MAWFLNVEWLFLFSCKLFCGGWIAIFTLFGETKFTNLLILTESSWRFHEVCHSLKCSHRKFLHQIIGFASWLSAADSRCLSLNVTCEFAPRIWLHPLSTISYKRARQKSTTIAWIQTVKPLGCERGFLVGAHPANYDMRRRGSVLWNTSHPKYQAWQTQKYNFKKRRIQFKFSPIKMFCLHFFVNTWNCLLYFFKMFFERGNI